MWQGKIWKKVQWNNFKTWKMLLNKKKLLKNIYNYKKKIIINTKEYTLDPLSKEDRKMIERKRRIMWSWSVIQTLS